MFDLDSIKNGEILTDEQLKELFAHEDKESDLPENVTQGKAPAMSYNPKTFTFEEVDAKIKELKEKRARLRGLNDPLANKETELKRGLEEIGLSAKDMGKTADSSTGKVSDKQRKIAESQIEDAKAFMLRKRLERQ